MANERLETLADIAAKRESVTERRALGNAAAMREALAEARRFVFASAQCSDRDLLVNDGVHAPYVLTPKETLAKIDAALAAPPRLGIATGLEATTRCCTRHGSTGQALRRGQNPDGTVKLTFAKWLLAPAKEKEGGEK